MSVCALLVVHNPPPGLAARAAAALAQTDRLLAFVNGGDCPGLPEEGGRTEVVRSAGNIGLAAAQNALIRRALDEGHDWLLFLDHDTLLADGAVRTMLDALEDLDDAGNVAMLVPSVHEQKAAVRQYALTLDESGRVRKSWFGSSPVLRRTLVAISSGSLVRASAFRELGLMREDFFIDYVDTDFCLRLNAAGREIVAVRDAAILHEMGARQTRRLFGLAFVPANYSPFRRFHICRNRVAAWRLHGRSFPGYVRFDLQGGLFDLFKVLAFENGRWAKLKACAKGFLAGMRMPLGPPPPLSRT